MNLSRRPRAERSNAPHTLMIVENLPVPLDRRVWQEASALRDAGIRVTVICPKGGGFDAADEVIDGIRVLRHSLPIQGATTSGFLGEYAWALFHEFRLAMKVAWRDSIDIVHVANPPDFLFLVALPFKLFGAKLLYDHHDLTPELYVEKFGRRGVSYWILRLAERASFFLADGVISTNESYRRIALERGGKRPEHVTVVRSGPDPEKMKPVEPDPSIRAKAKHIVGYVGIMGSQDGIDLLLKAADHLINGIGRRDVHFMLVGDGPELPAAKRLAESLKIDSYVTFAGYLTGHALNRTLSSIDIGVCPDPHNEYTTRSTMNKVMEYMAFGKPLVQFDLTEGRISAGDAALYARSSDVADLAAQIERLIRDPQLREAMGRRGRRRLLTVLSWQSEAPKLVAAYRRVLDGSDSTRKMAKGAPERDGASL